VWWGRPKTTTEASGVCQVDGGSQTKRKACQNEVGAKNSAFWGKSDPHHERLNPPAQKKKGGGGGVEQKPWVRVWWGATKVKYRRKKKAQDKVSSTSPGYGSENRARKH